MSEPALEPGQSDSGALEWGVRSPGFSPCIATDLLCDLGQSLCLSDPCQSRGLEEAARCKVAWETRESQTRGCRASLQLRFFLQNVAAEGGKGSQGFDRLNAIYSLYEKVLFKSLLNLLQYCFCFTF